MARTSKLEAAREAMGLSVRRVAEVLGTDISGYTRIEKGAALPKRDTAREIAAFFGDAVPLGMVYDPCNPIYDKWLTDRRRRSLRTRGLELIGKHPELGENDRRKARD